MVTDVEYVEELASQRGVGEQALRKWHERRRVPHRWRYPLAEAARLAGRTLDPAVFDDFKDQVKAASTDGQPMKENADAED